jgi:uncharacterized protein with PIN domain
VAIRTTIRFHQGLHFFLSAPYRNHDIEATSILPRSVKDLIESYGVPHVEIDFIVTNGSPVGFEYLIRDGDFIRVFPWSRPRRGGARPGRARPGRPAKSNGAPRFIADVHLKTLVRRLRMLGFDTLYNTGWSDEILARRSEEDNRILLSRDRQLLMRNSVTRGMYIRNTDPKEQIVEVAKRFDLLDVCSPLSRCIPCNGKLTRITGDGETAGPPSSATTRTAAHAVMRAITSAVAHAAARAAAHAAIPKRVREGNREFYRCPDCRKFYWKGSHVDRMLEILDEIRRATE